MRYASNNSQNGKAQIRSAARPQLHYDGRANEIAAAFAEMLRDRDGNVRLRDDVLDRFSRVLNWPAVGEIPQMPREAGVLHQRLDFRIIVVRDLLRLEAV